ncbi:hypothetical protein [Brachybacterium kimchii]|uniref:DUF2283 domain-containing protein n=1 Tax=Brachybacterium kimchii TaxID=2942909 RepID=A0ABY4N801_9MICO|nr:hypothetical protein [Brachybacterium kimchii]UQN30688.1 hypothetical protein M4486_05130 [Brachybacterium kimchii]
MSPQTPTQYLPELFAWLPDGGAVVNPSVDGKTVGIVLDLEHGDLTGHHFLELDIPSAESLAIGLAAALADAKERNR